MVSERGGQKEMDVLGSCGIPKEADVERMVAGSRNFDCVVEARLGIETPKGGEDGKDDHGGEGGRC